MTAIANHPHRVLTALADARAELSSVADAPLWSMDATDTIAALDQLQTLKAQTAELEARLVTHATTVEAPAAVGASSTANWLAHLTRTTRPTAHRTVRVAAGLETHPLTRAALAAGRVNVEQVDTILRALAELPGDLDPQTATDAERHLLDLAQDHDAKALRHLGRHLLEVVSPEAADAHQAKLLEREEADAAAATRLVLWDDGHGKVHGRFTLDTLTGAMLSKALLAIAAPKHQASQGPLGDRRPGPERLGQAFTELIQHYPTDKLPQAGGMNATVVVLLDHDTLLGGLKAAHLDTGETLSPSAARRLACQARIIPAVLDGTSHVLDLAREKRFATEAQRIAKTIEARGCEIDGCDWPPAMTHLHHTTRWADGGRTDLADLVMICPHHHARAHDQRYHMTKLPTGKYTFHRRT